MRERRRRKFNQNYKGGLFLGRASGAVVMIALMASLGLLIVLQVNQQSAKGYSLAELEKKRAELTEEKDRLQIEATRLQSIQEIQKVNTNNGTKLVPIQKINYLPTTNVAVK